MSERSTLVMKGSLDEFTLADVLQVIGMSRQYTAVQLHTQSGQPCGTIWVKAGRVIGARSSGSNGRAAFVDLFGPGAAIFVVQRLPEPQAYPDPLGSLQTLLMEALEAASAAAASTPAPAPAPTSAAAPARAVPAAPISPVPRVSPPRPQPTRAAPVAPPPSTTPRPARPTRPQVSGSTPPPLRAVGGDEGRPLDQAWEDAFGTPATAGTGGGIAVAITSPKGGVGKTTITLNLAFSLAQRGVRTLVVDADVNGDLMSLLAARDRVERGAYDILGTPHELAAVLRPTVIPNLSILPACGMTVPEAATARRSLATEWAALLAEARRLAPLVLVDCPAGMFDVTADVLGACTHAVGVVQSDLIASRSSSMLERGLAAIPAERRPHLLGVVVNMFQGRSEASLEAFHAIASRDDAPPLFETTIPRSDAFAEACLAGVPVRFAHARGQAPPVSWLFDMLATEVCDRTGIAEDAGGRARGSFVA